MNGPAFHAGPFMHNVVERLHTSAGNPSLRGNTGRDEFPRAPRTTGQPASVVGQGISPAVPATAWSCSASAAWIPAFAGMTGEWHPAYCLSFPRSLSPRRRGAGIHGR